MLLLVWTSSSWDPQGKRCLVEVSTFCKWSLILLIAMYCLHITGFDFGQWSVLLLLNRLLWKENWEKVLSMSVKAKFDYSLVASNGSIILVKADS